MTPEEFIRVFLPMGDGLYRVAFRLLGSQAEAEDAVQDLFIKVWGRGDDLDRVDNPRAWCLTLMRNLCIDRLRTRAGQQTVPIEENLPDVVTEHSTRMERTLEVVRALPHRSRELLRLRLVEDLSYEEISRQTGLSQTALRVAFHRLKNQLKKKI
ncbi:MAG: sigma-70 family RNA polymerase sigma factor [Bacteroidales bacterium]|nr:sigma-70 family RNA polymerase sigma factor [Bacteroidales bacterium]